MENKTIHESLQEYLKNTPKEKVLEDWDEFQHLDKEGITVKEFLENQKQTDEKGRPLTYWGGLEERGEETLEEVAERLYPIIETDNYMDMYDKNFDIRKSFIEGAKWQQQQMYSEDEVLSFGKSCFYKGFEKSEKDDANCYTAFREEIGKLFVDMVCNPKEEPKQEITIEEIEQQITLTEARGERVIKYLDKYKGQSIYNEIALAIEFGYQLKLEEDE